MTDQNAKAMSRYLILRSLAQYRLLRPVIVWGLAHMNFFNSARVIPETTTLVCFYHPSPAYPVHILLVPKVDLPDLMHLDPSKHKFLQELFTTVQGLVEEFNLLDRGYRLIVNGGEYQEFPQLHFHLISGE
jgi:histidine triad (HIT) family protein